MSAWGWIRREFHIFWKIERSKISLDKEEREHEHISYDSEGLYSCDFNLTIKGSNCVTYTLKYDSSGHILRIVFTVYEDYSVFSGSSSDESNLEDKDYDSSIPRNCLQSPVVVPKFSTVPIEKKKSWCLESSKLQTLLWPLVRCNIRFKETFI